MNRLPPIPTPLSQRWREFRIQVIPVLVFAGALCATTILWRSSLAAPTLTGEVETERVNVAAFSEGVLTNLTVTQFQLVKAGDVLATLDAFSPRSDLGFLQARSDLLRVEARNPHVNSMMDYERLMAGLLIQQADLATTKIELQRAENEYVRIAELYKEKLVSEQEFDSAEKAREALRVGVAEKTRVVDSLKRGTENYKRLADMTVQAQEAALGTLSNRLSTTEEQFGRILLRAPIDGMVTKIHFELGEIVGARAPVITISSQTSNKIVGFLRQPVAVEPREGMAVKVRTRGVKCQVSMATVQKVGTVVEQIFNPLRIRGYDVTQERGLPLVVNLPKDLRLRPGELVDLILVPESETAGR